MLSRFTKVLLNVQIVLTCLALCWASFFIYHVFPIAHSRDSRQSPETVVVIRGGERFTIHDPDTTKQLPLTSHWVLEASRQTETGISIVSNRPLTEARAKAILERFKTYRYHRVADDQFWNELPCPYFWDEDKSPAPLQKGYPPS